MRFTQLAVCLLAASGLLPAANLVGFTCGAAVGTALDNFNGTWALAIACADGVTFNGTATQIDTGDPSDYRIQGTFRDTVGGAFNDPIKFPAMPGFTQPAGPTVLIWHELHGVMNLGGNQGANPLATLSVGAGSLSGANGACPNDPGITTGPINGAFNVNGLALGLFAVCNNNFPLWTRGPEILTIDFNAGVAANGSVTLGQGASDNNFEGPEPASWGLMTLGLLALAARRRSWFPFVRRIH